MNLLVDTSVWSLALRRDRPKVTPEITRLRVALEQGDDVYSTGIILQELLQGFSGAKNRELIISHFAALPLIVPDKRDHLDAAELHSACRKRGIQTGAIDVLLAAICVRRDLTILSTDADFKRIASVSSLSVWKAE